MSGVQGLFITAEGWLGVQRHLRVDFTRRVATVSGGHSPEHAVKPEGGWKPLADTFLELATLPEDIDDNADGIVVSDGTEYSLVLETGTEPLRRRWNNPRERASANSRSAAALIDVLRRAFPTWDT